MSTEPYTAVIRFAPLTTLERVNDPDWKRPGRTMYDFGSLTLMPDHDTCPLIVDHNHEREVGVVTSLMRWDDETGPWLAALATVTDPPVWLKRDETKASFGFKPAGTSRDVFDCEILRRGLVTEVSILSPSVKPAEPLAKVLSLRRSAAAVVTSDRVAAAGNTHVYRREIAKDRDAREMDELRRRCDAGGWHNFEAILKAYMIELGYDHDLLAA